MRTRTWIPIVLLMTGTVFAEGSAGNRLAYLERTDPYYVGPTFPKLTTPMWVGEEGVDAVVILAIDDLRDASRYERFLDPVLKKLAQARADSKMTVFANAATAGDAAVASLLARGVTLEPHSVTHPCPLLTILENRTNAERPAHGLGPDTLRFARREVFESTKMMREATGSVPVAFRVPCCDSQNVGGPRYFAEILAKTSEEGDFLKADSSVPVVMGADFEKYLPDGFENHVHEYPYPYVVAGSVWEFPFVAPSDWQGQRANGPNSPVTLEAWKTALAEVVKNQGVFTLCFHPHGWIRAEQVAAFVEHAHRKYGDRIRFLDLKEAVHRLEANFLAGQSLRTRSGADNGVRILDVDNDGFLDVVTGNSKVRSTRTWDPDTQSWREFEFPFLLVAAEENGGSRDLGVRFFVGSEKGHAATAAANPVEVGVHRFDGTVWKPSSALPSHVAAAPLHSAAGGVDLGVRFRDIDGDGFADMIVNNDFQNAVTLYVPLLDRWRGAGFGLPTEEMIVDWEGTDRGARFVDYDADGDLDLVLSNEEQVGVWSYESDSAGWVERRALDARRDDGDLPAFVVRGADAGTWFEHRADGLWVHLVNEFERRSMRFEKGISALRASNQGAGK